MPVLPHRVQDLLAFAESHADIWAERAAEIGLSSAQAQRVIDLTGAARAARERAGMAANAARAAALEQRIAIDALQAALSESIKGIRLFGESTGDDAVFAAAEIPLPAQRSPAPPPPQPTDLSARLVPGDAGGGGGAVAILFKAIDRSNAGSITYLVRRKLPSEREFSIVGTVGSQRGRSTLGSSLGSASLPRGVKAFIDDALPAGADLSGVQYTIQGERGAALGPMSQIYTLVIGSINECGTDASSRVVLARAAA
ncbi:MAG: hypothetical protein K2W85_03555 [Phycisphaerales bacterium]|nr:hypothetical protein [Phycisphaerales bacterium]